MAYMPDFEAFGAGDYGALAGAGSTGGAAATAGITMSELMPYLQAILGAYQASQGASGTEQVEDKFTQMAQSQGINAETPDQPGSQSSSARAGRALGAAALNMVPVAGPVLGMLGGAYNADVDARDKEQYLQKLLGANRGVVDPAGIGLQSEYVPQSNTLARYFQSKPKGAQRAFMGEHGLWSAEREKAPSLGSIVRGNPAQSSKDVLASIPKPGYVYDKLGGVGKVLGKADAIHGIGQKVMGGKAKQKKREEAAHKANVKKIRSAEESERVGMQDATALKRTMQGMAPSGMPQMRAQQGQALLQRMLAPQGWETMGRGLGGPPQPPQGQPPPGLPPDILAMLQQQAGGWRA